MLSTLSGPRRRFFLVVAAIAVLLGAGLAILLVRDDPLDTTRVPVILVHGYGGTGDSMTELAGALRARGREVVAIDLPDRGEGDITGSARALADAVGSTGAAQVDLVGHSAGGVVIRAFLKNLGGTERTRRAVTLGSPHHGTTLANVAASAGPEACLDACAQLGRGSDFLAALNDGDETPGDVLYTSVWTDVDETVTPPDSAVLDGATNIRVQRVCPGTRLGHGDLVHEPLAVGLVLWTLDDGAGTPNPSDCARITELGAAALSS